MRYLIAALGLLLTGSAVPRSSTVQANDNDVPAGRLRTGVLTAQLVIAPGVWHAEGEHGVGRGIYAFGEEGGPLSNPGPLLRVPVATTLRISVHNAVSDTLVVQGLHDRPGAPVPIQLAPGERRTVEFKVNTPGTYTYWGTSTRSDIRDRTTVESQLHGVLVVDPPGAPRDRILVIGIMSGAGAIPRLRPLHAAVVNGRSWPHTTRLQTQVGDTVRMRWVNLSERAHPIHLHGFYFRVHARGNGAADTTLTFDQRRTVATELIAPGATRFVEWLPERAGNWLIHCHMLEHVSPHLRSQPPQAANRHTLNHTLDAMAGLVVGVHVAGARTTAIARPARTIRLLAQQRANDAQGFVIAGNTPPAHDSITIPGPPLVLTQNQVVQINVINRLAEPTSVHWHGIELDSYFDGVSGWSGNTDRIAPHIMPGDSFAVRFAPPRAGTFIYHTHFEEERQLAAGMYGPLIVLPPGESLNATRERMILISSILPLKPPSLLMNGSKNATIDVLAGETYRVRIINIAANPPLNLSLRDGETPLQWRPIAKDGLDLPVAQMGVRPAVLRIGVGETYDFEITPLKAGTVKIEAATDDRAVIVGAALRVR